MSSRWRRPQTQLEDSSTRIGFQRFPATICRTLAFNLRNIRALPLSA